MQIITATQLGELWNALLQAVDNTQSGVLANDTNIYGNPLTAQLVTGPNLGQVTLNADGSFSYTPNPGTWGTDSFTYTATDGTYTSAPATVTITVNSTPLANNDTFTTVAGQELDTSVAGDIYNADGDYPYTVLLTAPANGQLTLDDSADVSLYAERRVLRDGFLHLLCDGWQWGDFRARHGDHHRVFYPGGQQ